MPRACTICKHPDREAIEAALVAGESVRSIMTRYDTKRAPAGRTSLQRHQADHLPAKLAKAKDAKEVTHADDLLAQAKAVRSKAISLLQKAEAEGDIKTALTGCREVRGCIELLGKLMGELSDAPQINIHMNPQFVEFKTVIVQSLREHPEAARAVVKALQSIEVQQ